MSKAIKNDPDNIDAYYYRSCAYCALEKIGKASSDAKTMIEEFPDSNLGYIARSKIQKQLGNLEQSKQDLALAIKIQPSPIIIAHGQRHIWGIFTGLQLMLKKQFH